MLNSLFWEVTPQRKHQTVLTSLLSGGEFGHPVNKWKTVLNSLFWEVTPQHKHQTVLNSLLSRGEFGHPVNKW